MKKKKAVKYEEILEGAFGFNDYTLEYNGRGKYSEGQQIYFAQRIKLKVLGAILFALGNLVVLFLLSRSLMGNSEFAAFFLIVFILSLFSGLLGYHAYKMRQDLKHDHIEVVEGRVQLDIASNGQYGNSYKLHIGEISFNIHKAQFFALKNGDPYRVYYMPATKHILSLEWLYADSVRDVISTGEAVDDDAFALIDDFSEEVLLRKRR